MNRWDSFFTDMAIRSAGMSRALKMKVGATARSIAYHTAFTTAKGKP